MKIVILGITLVDCSCFLGCQPGGILRSNTKTSCSDNAYGLAKKYYHRGQYEKAIECFEEFVDKNIDSGIYEIALYYLAKSYKNIQDHANALLAYKKLLGNKGDSFWIKLAKEDMGEIKSDK
ncbi:MAG: tetratricopeptide repeat protein [Candidatus Omnitrophica bacterium]|nr:tetratricopeptide repeat protein [Candidatus Omnitrophota bacterium]MBU1997194.1 tetratricopeptide repeat protein [Candidatus Omnitrophota bacterium]